MGRVSGLRPGASEEETLFWFEEGIGKASKEAHSPSQPGAHGQNGDSYPSPSGQALHQIERTLLGYFAQLYEEFVDEDPSNQRAQ